MSEPSTNNSQDQRVPRRRNISGVGSPSVKSEFYEWEVGPNYEVEKIIGIGSYGSVCRAI
jgi:purine-nucleoside phosphorylase